MMSASAEVPQAGDTVQFRTIAPSRTREGIVQRVWGQRAANVSIRTSDHAPGQTFVRLAGDVQIIDRKGGPDASTQE